MDTFRAIPSVHVPGQLRRFTRLDFGPDPRVPTIVPAKVGGPFPKLVPAVDRDGNELAGIRLPFVMVPLATYTGWNLRHQDIGGADQVLASGGASGGTLKGSTIPFPATREAREASGDPRLSIEERYHSRENYLERIRQAAQALVDERYVLEEDLPSLEEQANELFDALSSRVKEPQAADN